MTPSRQISGTPPTPGSTMQQAIQAATAPVLAAQLPVIGGAPVLATAGGDNDTPKSTVSRSTTQRPMESRVVVSGKDDGARFDQGEADSYPSDTAEKKRVSKSALDTNGPRLLPVLPSSGQASRGVSLSPGSSLSKGEESSAVGEPREVRSRSGSDGEGGRAVTMELEEGVVVTATGEQAFPQHPRNVRFVIAVSFLLRHVVYLRRAITC